MLILPIWFRRDPSLLQRIQKAFTKAAAKRVRTSFTLFKVLSRLVRSRIVQFRISEQVSTNYLRNLCIVD